jgi:cytochrome P450
MSIEFDADALIVPQRYGVSGPPHEQWKQMREQSPVHLCESQEYRDFWAITKHADIMSISSNPEVFSNSEGPTLLSEEQREMRADSTSALAQMRTIIEMDPPEHRDYRKLASGFFTPRSIHRLDEIVAQSARRHVDALGEEGECDFIEVVAQRHPLRVLATLLGIDEEDEDRVLKLTQQLFAGEDPDLQRKGASRKEAIAELGMEFFQLFDRIVQDRRANPRDDLASMLANAKLPNGDPMGPVETFGYYLIVFTAGHDTTRNAISGGMKSFLDNPDQLELLKQQPDAYERTAVEEIVRYIAPVNYMRRTLLRDAEVGGQKLSQGEQLAMFYASANRDADVFERPDEFDIARTPNRHLGFGTGEHFCLGAHVARMSARALFRELATRVEMIEPAGKETWIDSSFVVGLKTLPIRYKVRSAL